MPAERSRAGPLHYRTSLVELPPPRALDEALDELAKFDERKAKIVEMKFFAGLSVDEMAEVLGVASITVMREWQKAKAWLYLQMNNT